MASKRIPEEIEEANQKVANIILTSEPTLVDVEQAIKVIPEMTKKTILHAGPPIEWERMCGPQRRGVIGAVIYEGLAETAKEAIELVEAGDVELKPCHHHSTVGSMAGITSASMWVAVVRNETYGNTAHCALYEGRGKTIAYGCYTEEVIERLHWMEETLGPALKMAVKDAGEINLKRIMSQAVTMGDELHNRSTAATLLFVNSIMPHLLKVDLGKNKINEVIKFMSAEININLFLIFTMASCKATMDAAHGIKNSTVVTAMARNGTDFGIRISGLGDQWFTAPSPKIKGLYFPGYGQEVANPDMGDSAITETMGLGGFAMAAAPAIVLLVGGTHRQSVDNTREMEEITITKNNNFRIPYMDFEGVPTGIDIRKVVETGISPIINTGIAHKGPGCGAIGAGITRAPMSCFKQALEHFAKMVGIA